MYVCVCKAVTDRQVRSAVAEGAVNMRTLRKRLSVCSGCGKCGSRVRQVFSQAVNDANCLPAADLLVAAPALPASA